MSVRAGNPGGIHMPRGRGPRRALGDPFVRVFLIVLLLAQAACATGGASAYRTGKKQMDASNFDRAVL
ncbi:MAG: hypothetical protein O7A63_09210, partial [Acidobacteria bacterium]|nr:hypothetical protein [Acidobacteriota bacterium]